MKIPKGKTLYIYGKRYVGEVPDRLSQYIPESMKIKSEPKTPKVRTSNSGKS